jgi:hypothetical protein
MRLVLRRTWYLLRQRQAKDDLAEEMDFHRAMTQQNLEARGLEPADAAPNAARPAKAGSPLRDSSSSRDDKPSSRPSVASVTGVVEREHQPER